MNVVEAALALVPERERLAVLLVDVNAAGVSVQGPYAALARGVT